MSLNSSFVPVLFDKALDQKNNYKVQLPGTFLTLDNAVRRKGSLWEKRYGFSATTNPPSLNGKSLGVLDDALCYADGQSVHLYGDTSNAWSTADGAAIPMQFSSQAIFRHNALNYQPSSACAGGLVMSVCQSYSAGNGSLGVVTVTDAATGAVVVQPQKFPLSLIWLRVVAIGSTFLVFGQTGGNIVAVSIPASTFATNNGLSTINTSTTIGTAEGWGYDVCLTGDGATATVVYQNTSHNLVVSIVTAGAVLGNGGNGYPAPVTLTTGSTAAYDGCLGVGVAQGCTFVAFCPGTGPGDQNLYGWTMAAGLTSPTKYTLDTQTTKKRNATFYNYAHTANTQYVIFLYECGDLSGAAGGNQCNIFVNGFSITGGVISSFGITINPSSTPIIYGAGLASKAVIGPDGYAYAMLAYDSNLQPSYFLTQFNWKGQASIYPQPWFVSHFCSTGTGAGLSRSIIAGSIHGFYGNWLFDVATDASGNFHFPLPISTQWTSDTSGVRTIQNTGTDLYKVTLGSSFVRSNLGKNVQFTAGQVNEFDGQGAGELGFHIYPEGVTAGAGTGGSLNGGTYYFKVCYEFVDNRGQTHRSTPSPTVTITGVAVSGKVTLTIPQLALTNKPFIWQQSEIQYVVYQSTDGIVFYRAASGSTGSSSLASSTFAITITSEAASTAPILYSVGGIVENEPVPACTVSHVYKNRLWLGGLERPEIWFSKEFQSGLGIAFSSTFAIPIEAEGGAVTAFATLDDKLIIFKRSALYYLVGEGPDDSGNGWDYPEPIKLPSSVGTVYPRSIVELDNGIIFKSSKGWYMLTRALQVVHIGAPVEDYDSLVPVAAVALETFPEVRFVHSNGSALVYNHEFSQWSTFSNYQGYDAILANGGTFYRLGTDGKVYSETTAYLDAGQPITLTVETSWLSLARLQGYQRIYKVQLLSDFVADHTLEVQIAYDFKSTYNQTINFNTAGVISGTTFSLEIKPQIQKCTAIKLKFSDVSSSTASLKPTSMAVEVGRKQGAVRISPTQSV